MLVCKRIVWMILCFKALSVSDNTLISDHLDLGKTERSLKSICISRPSSAQSAAMSMLQKTEQAFQVACNHQTVRICPVIKHPFQADMARCKSGQKAGSCQHVTISQNEICWIKRLDTKDID